MTRIPERVSNGPPSEGKSLADLINSSNLNTRKRKLVDAGEDVCSRRKKIAQHKTVRLKRIQKNYVDRVREFLTNENSSVNIWEGYYWKCPDIPTYLNYFKNYPLDPSDNKEDLITLVSSSQLAVASTSATPQSVSLFSVPEHDGSSTASASSPEKRLLSPLKSPATTSNNNNNRSLTPPQRPQTSFDTQEQIVEKAKQEAHVMQRINELQREGLWAEKRLPKVQEPPRVKAHWDYLLEEMVWLAADFAQERKWKKAAAKKCAKMVQKYFQDKELMAQKAVKSQELQLKRIASTMAKEVKQFWANVEKLVEYKQQTRLEEKRKKALDQHLSFIVDQTEKYSSLVAESMNKTGADASLPPSPSGQHHTSDIEFEPGGDSSDDEETIAKAEAEDEKEDKTREIELLRQESELPLDELLKDYMDNRDKIVLEEEAEEEDDASSMDKDEEFRASDKDTSDDEETIQEQEKAEGKVDHKQELDDLKTEGEMNIEELKAKYANLPTNGEPMETESQTSTSVEDEDDEGDDEDGEESESEEDVDIDMEVEEETPSNGLSSLLSDDSTSQVTEKDKDKRDAEINDVAALAESIQPKGNTLSSTSVVTKIPFLLKHTLREYQHIGLDWLVTMYDRKLNGILADEMGLGKTIQTISVLAHLACEKGNWGPHLIVVPTSVMLNWEMEFKKWCPAFKILTYYGSQKERKMKRTGWTKPNAFHVCITSYKLVIQDHQSFRRKSWKYLILDEAQNIKNFKSQRWQLLLNFQTQRRLLLTGTPLQNNLMELWSLMHFLMPNVFQSHREFKEWFSNPVTGMIEGNSEYNEQIIKRLHKVLRPFLLRRLKCEVEKQLPKKYEHVVMCRLSNRQRYLYDDFMSRAKTRETLATGNLLSVINVLMQLRKVCNHPNLFEVRPTVSPFQMEAIELFTASCVWTALDYNPFKHVSLEYLNLWKADLELWLSAFMAHQAHKLHTPVRLIEEIDTAPPAPPPCPRGKIKLHVRFNHQPNNQQVTMRQGAVVNPGGGVLRPRLGPTSLVRTAITNQAVAQGLSLRVPGHQPGQLQSYAVQLVQRGGTNIRVAGQRFSVPAGFAQLVQTNTGRHILFTPSPPASAGAPTATAVMTSGGQRLILGSGALTRLTSTSTPAPPLVTPSTSTSTSPARVPCTATSSPVTATVANSILVTSPAVSTVTSPGSVTRARRKLDDNTTTNSAFTISRLEEKRRKWRGEKLSSLAEVNEQRCVAAPMYGWDLVTALRLVEPMPASDSSALREMILGVEDRLDQLHDLINKFVLYVPAVKAPRTRFHVSHPPAWRLERERRIESSLERELSPRAVCLHPIVAAMMTQFPDPSLIQYDCGKLQNLDRLLRTLKCGQHRVLIFTQMTRMLDVLEAFLNFHGHIYLRLDGTTKVDQRQVLMERFNGDKRIFCFILSTRSGGVGVNLTGADTVIFYDSDWNPTMDAQAQDRCHRIGQTRDVHIYRLVSEKTIEENILKKANQKRMLGDLAIEGGNFTTAYFKSTTIQDLFNVDVSEQDASRRMAEVLERRGSQTQAPEDVQEKAVLGVLESAMAAAEDDTDVAAAKTAKAEAVADLAEFDETIPLDQDGEAGEEISKAEQELNALVQQLSGVEKYAMKFIEETEAAWSAEQLAAAEAEIEQQKREWEEERLAALRLQEELAERDASDASEELLTYAREDAQNQIWVSQNAREQMPIPCRCIKGRTHRRCDFKTNYLYPPFSNPRTNPVSFLTMWCPPTPPVDDSDVYIDHTMCFLYESTTMSEAQLPPVYVKKERKRSRLESNSEGRHPVKVRSQHREELTLMHAPRSLFDRPSPALVKMRHDLRLEKYRGSRSYVSYPLSPLSKPLSAPPLEPDNTPEWTIHEDWALLQAVQTVQELTMNLVVVCPGHTPNWEMVADMVNMVSRIYRSPRQCRNRYEYTIIPREEGKMMMDSKKLKKTKGIYKIPQTKCSRPMRTSQMYLQDNNTTLTQVMNAKFECIRQISNKRTPTMKPVLNNKPDMKNPKHAEVLSSCGIDYDKPMSPVDVAVKRADRISKEKQLAAQTHLALLRNHQMAVGAVAVNKTITAASAATASPPSTSAKPGVVVQERGSTPAPVVVTTAVAPVTATVPAKVITNNKLSPAQLQLYQQRQALLRQQQLKAAALQGRTTVTGQKVSVAVTSPTQARIQTVKQATGSVTRVSEAEMAALMKRQTAVASVANVASVASVAMAGKTAAILAQAGLQTQQTAGQVAALVKTVSGQHLPISIPQVKATLPGVKATTATPQQIRQLHLQNQLIAQQRSKLTGQKVAQLGQVMVTNKGMPTQLIVQSQKSVSAPMTVQQMQQIIKHVHPQHIVSASGQTVQVSQGTSTGQVISHTVIAKSQGQTRVIPQQNIKQTIQVVTASPGVRTSVPNVTIDSAGRPTVSVASQIKVSSPAQQQALINQVLQQSQQITVRHPLRIQTSGTSAPLVAVAVTQAPTLLTISHPPPDNTQNQ